MMSGNMNEEQYHNKCKVIYSPLELKGDINFDDIEKVKRAIKRYGRIIRKLKRRLKSYLSEDHEAPELDESSFRRENIISVFESAFTRTLKCKPDNLTTDFIIVETYFYEMFETLVKKGFSFQGDRYIFFTASAGQIRTKKSVFIREDVWEKHKLTIMCGLTLDSINSRGGMNRNKFLAYLALNNSATDEWKDFDINKAVVVDDFETIVDGVVDYIDIDKMSIERKSMGVPVPHTDGCGMVLKSKSSKNFMVRLPWIKGLMASFDFVKFINIHSCSGKIKDIYGKEYNVIKDGIEYIFTKSQFKTWDYYDSWDDYKEKFIKYNCQACKCNEEDDYISNSKLNYQLLQTLSEMTEDELRELAKPTIDKIINMASNRDSMLEVFGAVNDGRWLNNFQKCLLRYPELLNDRYCKQTLKNLKKSIVRDARAAKLDVDGKYLFVIPDLYAFCQRLFMGIEKPEGLLKDGEVSCQIYSNIEKLDCLRSPHLYREHAVRRNFINEEVLIWFGKNGVYTSSHDLISKLLQFDVDGDKLLTVSTQNFVEVAERHMKDIVPLYYEMKKAKKEELNSNAFYEGMMASYKAESIGVVSNDISKRWNNINSENATEEINKIKFLCSKNNFVIDFAKSLYMPDFSKVLTKSSQKVPHFFIYAKKKKPEQVEPLNNSTVNKLEHIIPNKHLNFRATNLAKFDYRNLMRNSKTKANPEIVEFFKQYIAAHRFSGKLKKRDLDFALYKEILLNEMTDRFGEVSYIADVLIRDLFHDNPTEYKSALFMFFGDIICENIHDNIGDSMIRCKVCGKRFQKKSNSHVMCKKCSKESTKISKLQYKRKSRRNLENVEKSQ